ncbi:MAG: hypothetical protein ISS78_00400 [Phycisphaerae bacterium]|nr:hypothetical protein [Phycisphaerae bacterium]
MVQMAEVSLQFQGAKDQQLLAVLMAAIAVVLVGAGIWQLVRGRWWQGAAALGAAMLPVLIWIFARAGSDKGPSQGFWMVLLAVQVAAAVGVFYAEVYSFLHAKRLAVLMALRSLAIISLMLVLFKPILSCAVSPRDRAKCYLPVLVDRSGSMSTVDEANTASRYVRALHTLATQRTRVTGNFNPVWHYFGQEVKTADKFASLMQIQPSGKAAEGTDIAGALVGASADYAKASLAGIILISDGIHNVSQKAVMEAVEEASVPIYAVGIGSEKEDATRLRNIELASVDAPLEAIKNNITTITISVKMTGMASTQARVQLLEEGNDQPVASENLWTEKSVYSKAIKLKWTPKDRPSLGEGAADVRKLRVVIPAKAVEAIKDDNTAELHVLITQPRVRVLYVEGSMRPEYKYLKRLLDTDPNIQFMSLVRVADNRFWAYGGIDGRKLNRLPTTDEDFSLIDVLVIGDLSRTFLSRSQLARIGKFVNDGGALLMLGGHSSFGPGGYGGTDVETVLPVVVGGLEQAQDTTAFLPMLTAAGQVHPVLDGLSDFFVIPGRPGPKPGTPALPDLRGCVTVPKAKGGAAVLAVHPTRKNAAGLLTVLAVQKYGAGRSAAFTADTTWQWYLKMRGMGADSPYSRLWGQLIRWLARAETKTRKTAPAVVARLDRSYMLVNQSVTIRARVQDQKGLPGQTSQVTCTIAPADKAAKGHDLPLGNRGGGLFDAEFTPKRSGKFRLTISAVDPTGQKLGTDELSLTVAPYLAEAERLARNTNLLRAIAVVSEGRYADLAGLPEIIDQIIDRHKKLAAPLPPPETYRLYNFWLLFLAFAAFMTGEWMLRRNWQLH